MMLLGRLKARFSKAGTTGTVLVKGLPMLDLAFACARLPALASSPSSVDRPAGTKFSCRSADSHTFELGWLCEGCLALRMLRDNSACSAVVP